ncbi:MAG: hypothetical protein HYT65_01525, partial [Candidatus Yanofskybacteria bacterium]|nr:hypothetical protein [Candidatus Yanofskybacteria bacterium]
MRRPDQYDYAMILLFLTLICGSILLVRNHEQKENPALREQNILVWKTIESGTYGNTNDIRKALVSNGFKIEYWANDALRKTPVSREKTRLELVLVSAGQLGFNDWVTYKDIYERAQELGLKLVPAETGPQLRLQYPTQPKDEWLHIAMEPLIASDGDPTIFDVMYNSHHAHNG